MDALVVACATRDHVNLLNNKHANSSTRFDLNRKLRKYEKAVYPDRKTGEIIEREVPKNFLKPWDSFTIDAKAALSSIVVSFKQNLRVINKANNKYEKWVEKDGVMVKELHTQEGVNWAIRKPMHKEFVYGKVDLSRIKVPEKKFITAIRKSIDSSFDVKRINSITDLNIQNILNKHLERYKGRFNEKGEVIAPEILAFSPEGIEEMNSNIIELNEWKFHHPIFKARIFEIGNRFPLGQKGNKKSKFVESAQGTNLYYGIYLNSKGVRGFEVIPLNVVIERQKQGLSAVPNVNEKGEMLHSFLSPNDLVYIPSKEELVNGNKIDFKNLKADQLKRIYSVNDFSTTCYFSPHSLAKNIAPKEVDLSFNFNKNKLTGSYDMKTASYEGDQIKDICIKLNVDRLGNVSLSNQRKSNYNLPKIKPTQVKESRVAYSGSKQIQISDQLEDSENSQLTYWAGLSPKQRFENFLELMNRFYEFSTPDWKTKKISIDL
jgi:CRISPR-associated endonuclease Csn1